MWKPKKVEFDNMPWKDENRLGGPVRPFQKEIFIPDCYEYDIPNWNGINHNWSPCTELLSKKKEKENNNGTHSLGKCQNRHRDYE